VAARTRTHSALFVQQISACFLFFLLNAKTRVNDNCMVVNLAFRGPKHANRLVPAYRLQDHGQNPDRRAGRMERANTY
jgi:hypothetical protein